jgi:hypothetical protein
MKQANREKILGNLTQPQMSFRTHLGIRATVSRRFPRKMLGPRLNMSRQSYAITTQAGQQD